MEWSPYYLCLTEDEANEEVTELKEKGRKAIKQHNVEGDTWTIFVQ